MSKVERQETDLSERSDIVRLIQDSIRGSRSIADVQRQRLLAELGPAFEKLNAYAALHDGFVDRVEAVANDDENDVNVEVVDELFRKIFGVNLDDLRNLERRDVDDILTEFGQNETSGRLSGILADFGEEERKLDLG